MPSPFDERLYDEDRMDENTSVEITTQYETTNLFNSNDTFSLENVDIKEIKLSDIVIDEKSKFYLENKEFQSIVLENQKQQLRIQSNINDNLVFNNTFQMFNSFLFIVFIISRMIFLRR